ncbi:hypothetical protein C8R44DRAFT_882080 [Mycena epipterygia]|nr:hypothetical protein C8R44DRAFT_882080 [Mycena epipterygia]
MPALPSSPLPAPTFSPVTLAGLILFVVVVLVGTVARLFPLHIGTKFPSGTHALWMPSASVCCPANASVVNSKQTAAATSALVDARKHLPITFKIQRGATPNRPHQTRARPCPSPLRAVTYAPEAAPSVIVGPLAPVAPATVTTKPPITVTLATLVARAYCSVYKSEYESDYFDSDDDIKVDGLRIVHSKEACWVPVDARSREVKEMRVSVVSAPDAVGPSPTILGTSHSSNSPLRRTAHVKRPSATSSTARQSVHAATTTRRIPTFIFERSCYDSVHVVSMISGALALVSLSLSLSSQYFVLPLKGLITSRQLNFCFISSSSLLFTSYVFSGHMMG